MQTKRSLPPLTALRAFEAAARHKSFKVAAEELHVTPSAVSHAVAALEEFLGVKLFHRRVRRLLLTDAGGAYLAPLTRAFDAISAATREISARNRADLVTLASMPTFARVWLMPRLKAFLAAHSDVDLRVRAAVDFTEMVAEDVDAAIVYGRGDWPGFVVDRLVEERMVPLCSPALRDGAPPLHAPAHLARPYPDPHRDQAGDLGHVAGSGRGDGRGRASRPALQPRRPGARGGEQRTGRRLGQPAVRKAPSRPRQPCCPL